MLVAPLSAAIGLDVDVVFVVGLAEDLVPGRLSEDALLPERVRALNRRAAAAAARASSTGSTGTCSPHSRAAPECCGVVPARRPAPEQQPAAVAVAAAVAAGAVRPAAA